MASDNEASCASDPNFAVICSFLECFGKSCGIVYPDIARLQEMIENTQEVPQQLVDLHIKLLRKTRKTVSPEKWERALVKFCHTYSNQDGWELERFGYKKARIAVKLRLLKVLLETQFDLNQKFKNEVNKLAAEELRVEPLGRDKSGLAYWCQLDEECNIRVYREDLDEENWELVAKDREGVASLISTLSNGEAESIPINEDSNSIEILEKPIIDTGQVTTSPSLEEEEAIRENGTHHDNLEEKERKDDLEDELEDEQEQDDATVEQDSAEIENDEEEMDEDEDITNDESSKQNTEEDDSLEVAQDQVTESSAQLDLPVNTTKMINGSADTSTGKIHEKVIVPEETPAAFHTLDTKPLDAVKSEDLTKPNSIKNSSEESLPLKSIETPVITSPLKLVNIAELKQVHEEKNTNHITLPIGTPINVSKKHNSTEETTESVMKSLEKLSGKNSLSFTPTDITSGYNKLSVKPIDQLAANLVRMQSEKLEKPSGTKSLEKIAENLARSGNMLNNSMVNGEDDRLPQDLCPRSQPEKSGVLRGHRGMDLSTSPRGWESTNEQSSPMDFSGIDLSSRKFNKSMDLSAPGYRPQNFQQREMDLSTKKSSKSDVHNLSYDARAVMMRNHAMVADLSKRQMPFTAYEMSSTPYHTTPRLPPKDEHRLTSYTLLSDASKIAALRMGPTSIKRPLEGDDAQSDILKRIRADVIPIRGSIDKRTLINNSWREETSEVIEEPLMMVHGEGSGSDCDAVNPGLGEPTEEPVMFFYGEGSGVECETGNPGDDTPTDNKETNQSKSEADSATVALSSNEILNEESLMKEVSTVSMEANKNSVKLNRNFSQSNANAHDSQIVGSTQEKPKFKPTLGVQVIPKSTTGSIKRLSRWDVGKPAQKTECDSSIISNEEDISQKEQYFPKEGTSDQKCSNKDESTLRTSENSSVSKVDFECLSSTDNLSEKVNASSFNEVSMLDQNSIESNIIDTDTIDSNSRKSKEDSKLETMQCDSSISSCQADTSEVFEPRTNTVLEPHSLSSEKISTNVSDSSSIVKQSSEFLHKVDNECKPQSASPPRFFFGPNCISYTSKPVDLENQSDQIVTTSIQCKSDTLQYECVSSSKPSEDTLLSYKSEEFDVTQTNNNSLKASSFDSHDIYCSDGKRDVEKVEGSSHTWNSKETMEDNINSAIDVPRTTQVDENLQSNTVQESASADSKQPVENAIKPEKSETTGIVSQSFVTNNVNITLNAAESLSNSPDLQLKQKVLIDDDTKTECPEEYGKNTTTDQLRSIDDKSYESTSTPQNVNIHISDNKQEHTEPLGTYSENEAKHKSSKEEISHESMNKTTSNLTTNICMSPSNKDQDQNIQMESNSVQECANEDNTSNNMLESADLISSGNYQEVHSSARVQGIDTASDDYQALKKDEADLSRESYDKHSEKNDNLSEFDMQEEQSMDTDTEKMKGQFSSDADSMSVNYDKNSERNDTLSDLGVQDEGSGDSEEIKEKHLANAFTKTNVSEDIPESDLVDNATVSSSACIQEYNNKESFASAISSSDDASVQNIFLQSNSNIPLVAQQIDNTFSPKTSASAFNILPPIVPNISIMKATETNDISSLKEIHSSSIDQSANEYADDVSENPSSCIDQDSNEDMIIDDRMSESNESSKEVEETSSSCDKLVTSLDNEKSTVCNDNLLSDQNTIKENQTNILDTSVVSDKENNVSVTAEAIVQEVPINEIEEKESSNVQIIDSCVEKPEVAIGNLSCENANVKLKEDADNNEKQNIVQNEVSSIYEESEANSTIVNKQSLVANYDSNDSNDDGSDDVFEPDTLEECESADIPNCSLEEHQINDGKVMEDINFEDECISEKNDTPFDEPQKFVHSKEEVESNLQTETDKVIVNNEIEGKKETFNVNTEEVSDIFSKRNTEVSYECNDIECSDVGKNEKTINVSNKDEYVKDVEPHNITPLDNSKKLNNTAPLILSASSDHSRLETFINEKSQAELQITSNQIVKEYMNNTTNNKNVLDETIITKLQNESKASIQPAQDVDKSVFEKLDTNKNTDNTENTATLIQVQENSGSSDINNQPTSILDHSISTMNQQQIVENMNEKSKVTDNKQITVNVAETLPKLQHYEELKADYLEDESEKNKFEVKTHNYIDNSVNETSGAEAFNQSITKISTIKLDNEVKQVSQNYETHSLVQLNDTKLSDNINLTNSIANKPTVSYNVSDDQSKQTDFINISNTHKDNIYTNSILNIQNTIAASTGQEETFERKEVLGIMRNDIKKEGNKRANDTSEVEDVPPLKSKPPYLKPFTESLPTDMKYNSKSETKVETVIEKTELKLEDNTLNKVNDSLMIPPITDYNAVIGNIQAEDNFRNDVLQDSLDVKDKKEPSEIQSLEVKTVDLTSDDSIGADHENVFDAPSEEPDPLACTEDDTLKSLNINIDEDGGNAKIGIRVKSVSELVYDGWKLDGTETPKVSRKRRNSAQDSNSEDLGDKQEEEEEMVGCKRIKLRAKRVPDKQLRKSVEESRIVTISSEDEAVKCKIADDNKEGSDDVTITRSIPMGRKSRGRPRGRRRRGNRGGGRSRQKHAGVTVNQVLEESPNIHIEGTPTNASSLETTPPSSQKKRKKRKMVLGLEIGRDIAPEEQDGALQGETPVRQSRRIAQLKIKEAADRRRIEEETLPDLKEKKETSTDKKKRRKQKNESEDEVIIKEVEKDLKSKRKRKKRKKKKMLAKFNEANPWQSSSGSSTDNDVENEEEEEEEEIETEGSLLFKSDHEFSPESDLEKDQESEPLRRARTAQKAQSDVEEADDEYACQKCGKADHPEWILLCDSCDKGWHCSCLRPALMLIPEGDWFCPPCQHNLLVSKLRESLKTYDQLTKRHENEVLRKKRLAFVGISLDNVLHKNEAPRLQKDSKESSQESENESSTEQSSSSSSSETSSSEESEPVYQLRERRCANTYKFNEYDDLINAAIQDDVEAVQGAGNQGRGKDIATIVNAEKEEAQLHQQVEELQVKEIDEDKNDADPKSEKESDEEYKLDKDEVDEEEEERKRVAKRLLARRKHRKLNSLDISSEDDPESDEDFKGTSSEDEEDFDDHMTSSDESSFTDSRRRSRKGDSRPVRRSTRARITHYDPDFINDDSDESDRPKRKKSRSMWENSESEESDNSWRQRKKKSRTIPTSRYRTTSKVKSKKKKKRKRIIESDNQSENEEEDEPRINDNYTSENMDNMIHENEETVPKNENVENIANLENIENPENALTIGDMKPETVGNVIANTNISVPSQLDEIAAQKRKKENMPKPKKAPTIRRKIIYGGLPDDNYKQEEEEILDRRSRRRGRKVNYQEATATDSEEELKKAIRKTVESEDEFVVNEADDINEDAEKDSDSDIYTPKKDATKFKNKSPKSKKPRKSKSPAGKRKSIDGTPKPRKKPGPKPGSKNKARKDKLLMGSVIRSTDGLDDKDVLSQAMDNPMGDLASKMDDGLPDNVGLTGTTISVASSFAGDVPEGSLGGLGPGELADLDDEQLEQIMMEDEEYGRRQLELAAIEIAKKKKKEEREAKKLEKARLKALEILAAERQRDPNAPEGTDGEVPKKKKRGRRSKAEILAEQMRRGGAPTLGSPPGLANTSPGGIMAANSGTMLGLDVASNVSPNINPSLPTVITPETERTPEGLVPMLTGPDGQLFNPDGTPMKPKRRGRGKGKKTLALEAARAAEAAAKAAAEAGLLGIGTDSNPEVKSSDIPNVLPTPGSSTSGSAPSTPPASSGGGGGGGGGGVPTQLPPSTQASNAQSVYSSLPPGSQQSSVITRMLQSQPVSSNNPQSFTAAAAAMGHKYFGPPNASGQMMAGPRTGYEMQPRGRIPSPYRQPGQTSMPPHFAAVRSGTPPMRMRVPGPQMYHTPHHPMDPSPSGGGPISISTRDRSSPLAPGPPAMIPPAAGSPLAKGGPTPPPPPPPYVRGGPPISRFADNPMGPRHQMPPFTNASPVNHAMQQPSPPPNRPPGNFSPYHPPPPPNYHYGAYPPPPPMSTADDAAAYQGSPYPTEHFSSPADNQPPIQAPPQPQPPPSQQPQQPPQPQTHPNDPAAVANKQYDEEGTGEFGGLVSYFSSQREDDLDS